MYFCQKMAKFAKWNQKKRKFPKDQKYLRWESFFFSQSLFQFTPQNPIFTFFFETKVWKVKICYETSEKCNFVMKPWSQSVHFLKLLWQHEIFGPVLWKKWGFSRNLTYFYFLLWHSFTWNWRKNGGFFFTISWHQKWNWLMVSWFLTA